MTTTATKRSRVAAALCAALCGAFLAGCSSSAPVASTTTTGAAPAALTVTTAPWRLPAPVSRAVVCADGDRLLVLGGLATGDTSTEAVWSVDPASGAGQRQGGLTRAVHDAGGVCAGGQALVFGGGSSTTVAAVQSWSPGGARVVGSLPQPRSDLGAAVLGGRWYVAGGFDGSRMTPGILVTSDGSAFSVAGALPVPVRYPAVAAAGGYLWIVGGALGTAESTATGGQTDAIQRFDPSTGRTTVVGHLPEPLAHATAVVLDGRLLVLGGRAGAAPSASIWEIDTSTGSARVAGRLPSPVSDAGAAAVGRTAWLVGGEQSGPEAPLDAVVELRFGPGG